MKHHHFTCIIFFLLIPSLSFGDQIKSISHEKDVVQFIETHFPDWVNFSVGLKVKGSDFCFCLDSLAPVFWKTTDFDQNGLTDLFLVGAYGKKKVQKVSGVILAFPDGKFEYSSFSTLKDPLLGIAIPQIKHFGNRHFIIASEVHSKIKFPEEARTKSFFKISFERINPRSKGLKCYRKDIVIRKDTLVYRRGVWMPHRKRYKATNHRIQSLTYKRRSYKQYFALQLRADSIFLTSNIRKDIRSERMECIDDGEVYVDENIYYTGCFQITPKELDSLRNIVEYLGIMDEPDSIGYYPASHWPVTSVKISFDSGSEKSIKDLLSGANPYVNAFYQYLDQYQSLLDSMVRNTIRPKIMSLAQKISEQTFYECEIIGNTGEPSTLYQDFLRMDSLATDIELFLLSQNENDYIKLYAFEGLCRRKSIFLFQVLDANKHHSNQIYGQCADVGINEPLNVQLYGIFKHYFEYHECTDRTVRVQIKKHLKEYQSLLMKRE